MRLVERTDDDRTALGSAQRTVRSVRAWRRCQAVHLLGDGREAGEVAEVLGCRVSSVYSWADDGRAAGLAGTGGTGGTRRRAARGAAAPAG
jgi:transposase